MTARSDEMMDDDEDAIIVSSDDDVASTADCLFPVQVKSLVSVSYDHV
jgi:hypothetical protein